MGLGSVMQTALSGMTAASTSIDVIANNLANVRSPGFKASRVRFASHPYQTYSLGSGPTTANGGTNPIQVGRGVGIVGITPDFSQGTLEIDDQLPLLALQGEGFFILEGRDGDYEYTRDGNFTLNNFGELVSATGDRVLGYSNRGAEFNISGDMAGTPASNSLSPIQIQIGSQVESADGTAATLTGYQIAANGLVVGLYDDGVSRTLGQLLIARFSNPSGLSQRSDNTFQATNASGMPIVTQPGQDGAASVVPGATELANVDIGRELIELMLAKDQFRANLMVVHTAGDMLEELLFLSR